MRGATIRMQRDGNFGYLIPVQTRLDDHLRGELHPRTALIETFVQRLGKSAQAAIDIVDRRVRTIVAPSMRTSGCPTSDARTASPLA